MIQPDAKLANTPVDLSRIIIATFLLAAWILSMGQEDTFDKKFISKKELGHPFIHNHSPEEFNSTSQVWCSLQDSNGIMYFGNNRGVLQFDGVSWRTIPVANNTIVRSLAIDDKGRIYVGAYSEFGYLETDSQGNLFYESLTDLIKQDVGEFEDIYSVSVNGNEVYFQGTRHIFRYKDNSIKVWETEYSYHRSYLVDGKLYLRQVDTGLTVLKEDSLHLIPGGEFFAHSVVSAMIPMNDGKILIGSRSDGLFMYDGSKLTRFKTPLNNELIEQQIYHGIPLSSGHFAIGTIKKGVYIFDKEGELIQCIDKNYGLIGNMVLHLYEDKANSLWISQGNGISHAEIYAPIGFFGKSGNLQEAVYGIGFLDKVAFAATDAGIYFQETGGMPSFKRIDGLSDQSWCFLNFKKDPSDPSANLLLAGTNEGVYEIYLQNDNYSYRQITDQKFVFKLYQSKRDPSIVFVAIKDGVSRLKYRNGKWEVLDKLPGIFEKILSIIEDQEGNLWLGTNYSGVIQIDYEFFQSPDQDINSYIKRYGKEQGLPSNIWNHVYYINDELLAATTKGIYVYDQKDGFKLHEEISRAFNSEDPWVYQLDADASGNIWFDSNQGKGALVLEEDGYTLAENQLKMLQPSQENEVAVFASDEGVIWFGSPKGLVSFRNTMEDENKSDAFKTLIRKVYTDSLYYNGNNTPASTNKSETTPEIQYSRNSISFEYAATSLDLEFTNQYQYLLEGFNDDWSDWTSDTKKDFTNLSPGFYVFKVRSKDVNDQLSDEASYEFTILAPFYSTWLAKVIYVIGATLLIMCYIRWRTHILHVKQKSLEKIVTERTEELKGKNLELRSKNEEISLQADELKSLNERLNSLNEHLEELVEDRTLDLEEKNKKLEEYAFTNAHELRAPVANLLGLTQHLDDNPDVKETRKYHSLLRKIAVRLNEITFEIRDRLEREGREVEK